MPISQADPAASLETDSSASLVNTGRVLRLVAILAVLWLPALAASDVVARAVHLYPLDGPASPPLAASTFTALYLWTPAVIISACILFISPGLLASLAVNQGKSLGRWVLYGFSLSLVILSLVTALVQGMAGQAPTGGRFAWLAAAVALVCGGAAVWRSRNGRLAAWPLPTSLEKATLASMVAVPLLVLAAMLPKFVWDNFNGDGAHAYESARLLLVQPLPFWPAGSGDISAFPGITSLLFAYPGSWFIRLFGELEVAARLPFLLYLTALFAALLAVIEFHRRSPFTAVQRGLLWLGLVVYTVVMAYSATYNPYSADIALPATQDTLLMVVFLGFILSYLEQDKFGALLFALLTFLASPNGFLLLGFWAVAALLVVRPRPWAWSAGSAFLVAGLFVLSAAATPVLAAVHLPVPGQEYGLDESLKRFAFLQWADWRRLLFLLVPGGIVPGLSLLAWRWQDSTTKAFTLVTAAYFTFFYVQAHISLHHFSPVMVLPLVVFWRISGRFTGRQLRLGMAITAAAGLVSLIVSLPSSAVPHREAGRVGTTIENRIAGYPEMAPHAVRSSDLLQHLFPYDWDPEVPHTRYGGSPLVWNYYARRSEAAAVEKNYVVQASLEPDPPGAVQLAEEDGMALYVRDEAVWHSHQALKPETPAGSPLYVLPRGILFRSVPLPEGAQVINVVALLESAGVDMDPWLARLGVAR